jgi:hypothetical protein
MVEQMVQHSAGDVDAEIGHIGEIRQAKLTGRMNLPEHDVLRRPMQATPQPDAAFQGAAHVGVDLRVTAAQLLENRDGAKAGRFDKNGYDLSLPDRFQRIGPAPCARRVFL